MNEDKARRQRSRKRAVTVLLIVCAAIIVLSLATASLDPDRLVKMWFGRGEKEENEIYFYPIEDDLNVRTDREYAQLDRRVHYGDMQTGATYSLEEEELSTAEPYARFFYYYFESIVAGDDAEYTTYFTDDYLRENELPEGFTPQMVYDIRVTPYLSADSERGGAYLVDYKILRNNGTFRRDVGSNASRTLLFTLVEEGGELYIDALIPYTQY